MYLTESVENHNRHQLLHCYTNRTENLRLIDGTLAITAIYEKYCNKDFTSAKITTKQNFTYGRFEIRAALPKGKMLRPIITFIPATYLEWARNGQIDVMDYFQNNELRAGLHYNVKPSYTNEAEGYLTNSNLNDFHTYSIEWDKFEIKWFFDENKFLTKNISRNLGSIYSRDGQPFDQSFRLLITLGIGPFGENFFPIPIISVLNDVMDWKCSLFIIDYVRTYKWVDRYENLSISSKEISADKICETVMPHIRPKKKENESNSNNTILIVIVSISSFVLFIILISIVFLLSIHLKKSKRDINVVENIDHKYDDTNISYPEFYDELSTNYNYLNIYSGEESENVSNNDYTNPLEVVTKHCVGNENEGKH
jgi:beta-glucanase (GH16 family)